MKTNIRCTEADWSEIKNFAISEWKHNSHELEDVDFGVIKLVDKIRDIMGSPMIPSPVAGAFSRKDGSTGSRHYAVGKLSTAGDFFIPRKSALEVLVRLASMQDMPMGIGIYLDTVYNGQPCVMIHIDLRDKKTIWLRDGDYIYDHAEIAKRLR